MITHLASQSVDGGRNAATHRNDGDFREDRLFRSLDVGNTGSVSRAEFARRLALTGLRQGDARLRESMGALDGLQQETVDQQPYDIPRTSFARAIRHNIRLIERAIQGDLVILEFDAFRTEIDRIYEATRKNRSGNPADYIPQLNFSEPEADQYGVALCTIDGQRHAAGDSKSYFSVQSMSKPITYCLALEEHGPEIVHKFIGHEPSGVGFNELTLDSRNRPHNPMINAGAIMSAALVRLNEKRRIKKRDPGDGAGIRGWAGERFDHVIGAWQTLCGGEKPRFSTSVYLSERETADRNFALAHYMRERDAFPGDVDMKDVLDFYFQCCSLEVNAEMMSVLAATLANGGICPVSGERVFHTQTVQQCLSLMATCGMYDYSGEFAFAIGLPAKSGVSGGIMLVIPNVMGFCIWSPRLDKLGNSVRGLEFCRALVKSFNFHNFDTLTGPEAKRDPRIGRARAKAIRVNELIWAASKGDLGAMQDQLQHGMQLCCADYDKRTPLHLAAAENQVEIVRFYIERSQMRECPVDLNPRDRWGGTPLDDAYRHGNEAVIAMLEDAGAGRGAPNIPVEPNLPPVLVGENADSDKIAEMIWAASTGDLTTIYRLVAQGVPLDIADYDLRTPLHLTAAEGHCDVVAYFVAQQANLSPQDRWGNTPSDDAQRHGYGTVSQRLKEAGAQSGQDAA